MGYELNKLMKQYGVATPGMVAYTGAAAPGEPPKPPTAPTLADNATNAQKKQYDKDLTAYNTALETYNKDKAAFDETMRKYGLSQKEYNQYRDAYQGRLSATPMYSDKQFYTGPSTGMKAATAADGIGTEKYNQNIQDFLAC